jgi:beta-lactamase regulating signal transducer with metallopeptidase domain
MMGELFISILNMSLTASYVILFVILIRLPLKKAPKFISYALWGVVAFRLIIPFSFESVFSLLPRNKISVPIPPDIIYQQSRQIDSGIEVVDTYVGGSLPAPTVGASVNPLQIYIQIGAYIWIIVMVAFLIYSLVSVLLLKKQLKNAQLIEKNIYEAGNLKTPFILGFVHPKIYLPVGLSVEERSHILLHEQTHIHRKDHIIKILAFLILSIHWFNPLVWVAFILMNKDMELSCDEKVLKEMDADIKKPYANSLLSLATGRHILNGYPLAFGEGNVKGRIKNVLDYRKPKFWVIVFSIIIVMVVGIGLITNPKVNGEDKQEQHSPVVYENTQYGFRFYLPETWRGYTIVEEQWKGTINEDTVETGPQLLIRHPDWIRESPRQDIPIMVFTLEQWNALQNGSFFVSAAPIGPRKLGRNSSYVFALPARYNYAYQTGFEEVEEILEGNPLLPSEDINEKLQNSPEETTLEPIAPKLSPEQMAGVDMTELDYASDDIIIFHDYFGLFVYELNTLQIIRSLDLKSLNCHYTQGDYYCDVSVSKDGNTVQLHPMNSENMYVYTISSHTLQETTYKPMEDLFKSHFVPIEEVINTTKLGNYSHHAVYFGPDEYGYLHTEDGTIGALSYVRGDTRYNLFEKIENTEVGKIKLDGYLADAAGIIDRLLSEIMSSPLPSSNPGDYIKAHQKEYDEIVSMGEEAMSYLIGILDGGDRGLRGNIVRQLCEDTVKNLSGNKDIPPTTEKLIKETLTSIDNWNNMMGYPLLQKEHEPMPEFTNEEVAKARAVVEEYYRAVAEKDSEAILSTMYPREHLTIERVKSGNVQLFGTETRILISIDYDSQDKMRRNYRPSNHQISDENIIVFKVSFNIEYPLLKDGGPWNEGVYDNWSMILIRDDEKSPWLIYDQGY